MSRIPLPAFLTTRPDKAEPRAPDGWALQALIEWEGRSGPVIGRVLTAPPERRSVVYAALAALAATSGAHPAVGGMTDAEVVDWMLSAKTPDILTSLYPPAPGMVGVLARTGGEPLEPSDYAWLAEALGGRGPRAKRIAQCLAHTRRAVTPEFLAALRALRTPFLRPMLVDEIESVAMAAEIEDVADLIQRHCLIPDHVLVQRMCQGGLREMRSMCESFLLTYGRNLSDIEPCSDFDVCSTGEATAAIAQRFRNCARSRIVNMALGFSALLVWRHAPAVIEVLRAHDGEQTIYICDGIYGVENEPVEPRMRREIVRRLRSRGILTITLTSRPDVPRWLADTYGTVEPMLYLSYGGGA